jgi:hypothetical protein
MLDFLVVLFLGAIGFMLGYWVRGMVSRKRRAKYLKYQPYLPPHYRPTAPPAFLIHPANTRTAPREESARSGGRLNPRR